MCNLVILQQEWTCEKISFCGFSDSVKQEPQADDFTSNNGMKRKRVKVESMEGMSQPAASPK